MNFNEKRMRRIVGILCVFTLVFTMFDLGMNEVDAKEEETYTYEEIAEMFSDHHVCDAIWDALLYGDQTEVKKSDFDRMEVLMIDGGEQELIDLTGLEHLSSLKNLTISHATLDSDWISKLKEINLESLTFTKVAGVNTLSGLGEYTKLTQLTLNNMPELSSLSGIEECENIEMISIGSSGFEDVSAIKNLKNLRVARLAHVKNIDMSIFEDLDQLTELNLFQAPGITDISSLKNKESLQELNIMGTGALSDTEKACETLRTLTNLKVLRVAGSDVNDLVMDAICDLTNLESLQIQNTSITDISKIVNLKSLKEVDIYENIFVDFSYFGELIKNGSLSKIAADEQVMIVKSNDYQFKNCVVGTDGNPVVPAESGLFTYNSEDNTITINSENRDNVAVDNESAYHGEVNKYYKKIFGEDMAGKKYYGVKASYVVPVESESISNKKAVVYYLVEKNEIIITKQPEATECTEGDKVEFEVTATSEDSELTYQWYKDGEAITGETSEKLVIDSAKTEDAGKYTCEVKNGTSSATSDEAVLTVNKKINTITITKQPEATECTEGDKVEFEVTATSEDSEFTYQWYKDGEAITGETSEKLVIESAKTEDAGKYTCEVKNGTSSVTSDEAVLTVNKKEEPSSEEPSSEEPASEEPSSEEPSTEEPTTEVPATEAPTISAPTTKQPETTQPVNPVKETTKSETKTAAPKTGDHFNFILMLTIIGSAATIVLTGKNKTNEL